MGRHVSTMFPQLCRRPIFTQINMESCRHTELGGARDIYERWMNAAAKGRNKRDFNCRDETYNSREIAPAEIGAPRKYSSPEKSSASPLSTTIDLTRTGSITAVALSPPFARSASAGAAMQRAETSAEARCIQWRVAPLFGSRRPTSPNFRMRVRFRLARNYAETSCGGHELKIVYKHR